MWTRIFKYGLIFFFGLYIAACNGKAAATAIDSQDWDITSQLSYCASDEVGLDLERAMNCHYVVRSELPRKGIQASEQWLRLEVNAPINGIDSIAIHIGPYYLRDIRFFEFKNQQWHEKIGGVKNEEVEKRGNVGNYTFIANLDKGKNNIYYVKLLSGGLNNFYVKTEAWPPNLGSTVNQQIGLGIHIGAISLITLFAIVSYLLNPNQVMGRLIFAMTCLVLVILTGNGLLTRYFESNYFWINLYLFNWLICLRQGLWVWVGQAFLTPYKAPKWYTFSCNSAYLITAISCILIALDKTAIAQTLILFVIVVHPVFQALAIALTPGISKQVRRILIAAYLIADVFLFLAIYAVTSKSWENDLVLYILRLTDFVGPLLILTIIAIQNKLTRQELTDSTSKLMAFTIKSDFESKLLNERRVLVDMLIHELKNPLASINMAIGSLKMSLSDTSSAENRRLHNISQSIESMDTILEKCSLMNTVDQEVKKITLTNVNLVNFLKDVIQQQPGKHRLKLIESGALIIQTDTNLLKIVVENILENALKYSLIDSVILIEVLKTETTNSPDKFEIVVTNKIDDEWAPDPSQLFNRFYRHPLARQTAGSGLGLYLVKEICRLLGGSIRYTRTTGSVKFHIEVST